MANKKKPSEGLSKKKKSSIVKMAKKKKDIGKPGKGFAKIVKKASKKHGKDRAQKIAAAQMWKMMGR